MIKQLDEVRKDNKLDSMEDLQKAVEATGLAWEDYKTQMRNKLLTQEVIRREVGGRMNFTSDEIKKYYDAHKQEFNTSGSKCFSPPYFLSTDGKTPEEISRRSSKGRRFAQPHLEGRGFHRSSPRAIRKDAAAQGGEHGRFQARQAGEAD